MSTEQLQTLEDGIFAIALTLARALAACAQALLPPGGPHSRNQGWRAGAQNRRSAYVAGPAGAPIRRLLSVSLVGYATLMRDA
jgi:hypothetical protein